MAFGQRNNDNVYVFDRISTAHNFILRQTLLGDGAHGRSISYPTYVHARIATCIDMHRHASTRINTRRHASTRIDVTRTHLAYLLDLDMTNSLLVRHSQILGVKRLCTSVQAQLVRLAHHSTSIRPLVARTGISEKSCRCRRSPRVVPRTLLRALSLTHTHLSLSRMLSQDGSVLVVADMPSRCVYEDDVGSVFVYRIDAGSFLHLQTIAPPIAGTTQTSSCSTGINSKATNFGYALSLDEAGLVLAIGTCTRGVCVCVCMCRVHVFRF